MNNITNYFHSFLSKIKLRKLDSMKNAKFSNPAEFSTLRLGKDEVSKFIKNNKFKKFL